MKYVGSKSRVAKQIVPIINRFREQTPNGLYIEPFVGGANVIDKVLGGDKIGYDANPYLIALLNHVKYDGWLPDKVSRTEYESVRSSPRTYAGWYVGCVGFLASYNGKFFGGYAGIVHTKAGTTRDYYDESRRNLLAQAKRFKDVQFVHMDYRDLEPTGCVIYCDPPYASTTGYAGAPPFKPDEFWAKAQQWAENNTVLVSEQTAPDWATCIWEQEVKRTLDNKKRTSVCERLYLIEKGEMKNE